MVERQYKVYSEILKTASPDNTLIKYFGKGFALLDDNISFEDNNIIEQ